jgi:enoyl-CoA hydratase/carnithine racemase
MSNSAAIELPQTYVTSPDSHIRVTNYPDSNHGVTPILIVTLNRPQKLNAITEAMIHTLIALFKTVNIDTRVKAVILTGAGKAFSAGIDLTMDTSKTRDILPPSEMRDPGGTLALAMFNCSKPVIVAYNGLSVGIGMTSTLAAAIRYLTSPSSPEYRKG